MEQLIHVKYFAGLRELIGRENEELEVDGPVKLNELLKKIISRHTELTPELDSCAIAVNQEIVDPAKKTLNPGDEVALLPPFGGG